MQITPVREILDLSPDSPIHLAQQTAAHFVHIAHYSYSLAVGMDIKGIQLNDVILNTLPDFMDGSYEDAVTKANSPFSVFLSALGHNIHSFGLRNIVLVEREKGKRHRLNSVIVTRTISGIAIAHHEAVRATLENLLKLNQTPFEVTESELKGRTKAIREQKREIAIRKINVINEAIIGVSNSVTSPEGHQANIRSLYTCLVTFNDLIDEEIIASLKQQGLVGLFRPDIMETHK